MGYSPCGQKELDTTEMTLFQVYSKVMCLYIYMYILKNIFSIIVCYRILNIVPCAIQ